MKEGDVVVCISRSITGMSGLTVGKEYTVLSGPKCPTDQHIYLCYDDNGCQCGWLAEHFKLKRRNMFKRGDVVLCTSQTSYLTCGKEYVVDRDYSGNGTLYLKRDDRVDCGAQGWNASRFKKVSKFTTREKDLTGCNSDVAFALNQGKEIKCETECGKAWISDYFKGGYFSLQDDEWYDEATPVPKSTKVPLVIDGHTIMISKESAEAMLDKLK